MASPVAIFAQGIAIAAYPAISAYAAQRETKRVISSLSFAVRAILFMTIPSTVFFISLRGPLIQVLFQRGMFTSQATSACAEVLAYYSIGICFFSVQGMLTRGFFALQDVWAPLRASLVATTVFVAANLVLRNPMGPNGLALAASIGAIVHTGLLVTMLRVRTGGLDGTTIVRSLGKFCVAACAMWAAMEAISGWTVRTFGHHSAGALAQVLVSFAVGGGIYIGVAWALRSSEMSYVADLVRRKTPWRGRKSPDTPKPPESEGGIRD
jgi:putative peptidoglycan lipid II flippase